MGFLEKLREWKKIFKCKTSGQHSSKLQKWHWTHGPSGNDCGYIRALYQCAYCGERVIIHFYGIKAKQFADLLGSEKYGYFS